MSNQFNKTFCAKCSKEIDFNEYGTYHSMGEHSYGVKSNPYVCNACFRSWEKHFDKHLLHLHRIHTSGKWQEEFEIWLGRQWDSNNPYPHIITPEKVVFT